MDKEEALRIIYQSADLYDSNLKNKNLLFLCTDHSQNTIGFETLFLASSFMHLTGVKFAKGRELEPNEFYNLCLNRRLNIERFQMASDGTTELKLSVLPRLFSKNLDANMLGDFNGKGRMLYTEKIAGSVRGGIGFVFDVKRQINLPNTAIKDDVRDYVGVCWRIISTYRKDIREQNYCELIYKAKKVDWSRIEYPDKYKYIIKPVD